MTFEKALSIIRKKNPLLIVRAALEFNSFYLFTLAPIYVSDEDEYVTGTIFPAVDKKSGHIFEYDITSDLDAFDSAIKVL